MKKWISALLLTAMTVSLAACSKGGGDSSAPVSSTPEPTISVGEIPPLDVRFLTGEEKGSDYPEGQRITAVMVNNIAGSRPTKGLSDAKVLYEIKVEGGITRFMALYEDAKSVPTVGSIRSARDQFFQLIMPFWAFYVHDGESTVQKQYAIDWDYKDFDIKPEYGSMSYRDKARQSAGFKTEYTEYTDAEYIGKQIEDRGLDTERTYNSSMFSFTRYDEEPKMPADGEAQDIPVIHSASYRTLFNYDAESKTYKMSQFNSSKGGVQETVDESNGEQLDFTNVLVLFAPMSLYPNSPLVKVDYGGGVGYYFYGGQYELIRWAKGGPQEPLRIMDGQGNETTYDINPGKSYVAIVDDTELETFYNSVVAGNASAAVAEGETNTNEVETED